MNFLNTIKLKITIMFKWLTNLFRGIGAKAKAFGKKIRPFLIKEIPAAITVVNMLKYAVENPLADFATMKIPGETDDKILAQARTWLPKIAIQLGFVKVAADASDADIAKACIEFLQSITKDKRKGKYLEIAAYITEALADGKLSWSEVVRGVQMAYDEKAQIVAYPVMYNAA